MVPDLRLAIKGSLSGTLERIEVVGLFSLNNSLACAQ
jgi:hypothetical protein